MKNSIAYLITVFVACSINMSCKKQLDLLPKTELSTNGFFGSYDGAYQGVSALYSKLGNNSDGLLGSERFMMPSIISQGASDEFKKFAWSSSSGGIISLWRKYYAFIAQANILIQSIESNKEIIDNSFLTSSIELASFKSSAKETSSFSAAEMLLGEIRFLRAYAYFTLYRYYGGVPLILQPQGTTITYVPRATREEIFTFLYNELNYSLSKCVTNLTNIPYGRVTKGAVAGLLAKVYVFHASYIKRAKDYGSQINESSEGPDVTQLYSKAKAICDEIINGTYGNYKLVEFYPSIFTKPNQEIMFGVLAVDGVGTGNIIPMGIPGTPGHGATNGPGVTSVLPQLYDIPMWHYGDRFKTYYKTFGESDIFQTDMSIFPHDSLVHLFAKLGVYSLTGDTTRRMWNAIKGFITGPKSGGLPYGLWIFEPIAQSAGPEFFIPPGNGTSYSGNQNSVLEQALAVHERDWWRNNTINSRVIYQTRYHALGKFRNLNPASLSDNFDVNNSGVDYPILRLGEIYLLKAEAQLFSGDKAGAISTLNLIRDRASNQSTIRDLCLSQGDAIYTHLDNSVEPIPQDLNDQQAFKELIYERTRELCGEDDCTWFDNARFPTLFSEDLDDISRYSDPLQGMNWFVDPNSGFYGFNSFNTNKVFLVLLPIPFSEFNFFPDMKQNPGY